jgi:hypothetical protein
MGTEVLETKLKDLQAADAPRRFALVGAQIMELGQKLNALRVTLSQTQTDIAVLEAELAPLLVEHQQLLASLVGMPLPKTAAVRAPAAQAAPEPVISVDAGGLLETPIGPVPAQAKQRVISFLREQAEMEESVTASDVASQLSLPVEWVRAVMMAANTGRKG